MEPNAGNGGASEGDIRGDISDMIEGGGVVDLLGGHLLVHEASVPDMTVVVDAGVGYIPNDSFDELDSDSIKCWEAVVAGNTASRTLAIGANSSGQVRVDLVCIDMDTGTVPDEFASNVATLVVVAGTPGAGQPATPANNLLLGVVTVANGATAINNAAITDAREQVVLKSSFLNTNRVVSITSSATPTPNADVTDLYLITALAANATVGAPTGTPRQGQKLLLRIKDNGTARTLSWNAIYRAVGTYLPTTTVISKTLYIGMIYNETDTKWDVVATVQE